MKFKIIGDSSLDMNETLNARVNPGYAPLIMTIADRTFVDDENLNLHDLMDTIAASKDVVKTAAPSPNDFLKYMSADLDGVFIITLSSKLSGTYNSATVAKQLAKEQFPDLKVEVIDSLAASAGETTIAILIQDCIDKGMQFEEIMAAVDKFKSNNKLYFLLDNIDTLVKNGRMSLLKGLFAQLLHIKPILGATPQGEIDLYDKARTYGKALEKLAELFYSTTIDAENRVMVIAHCFAEDRAKQLKQMVETKRTFKDIVIVPMKGLSSVYANVGGLVCAM